MADTCEQRQRRGHWNEDRLAGRCSFPIGPWNTVSNLAYAIAGIVAWKLDPSPAGKVMAIALVALCIGSGLYHGFKTLWSNTLDWVGMYIVFGCLAVHGVNPTASFTPAMMAVTGVLLAAFLTYIVPNVSLDVQMGLLYWFSSISIVLNGHWIRAVEILAVFLVAYGLQTADRNQLTSRWGHAVWHVLSAIGITLIYLGQR